MKGKNFVSSTFLSEALGLEVEVGWGGGGGEGKD